MNARRGVSIALLGAAALAIIALPRQRPEARRSYNPASLRVGSAAARLGAQLEHWRVADSRAIARSASRVAASSRQAIVFADPPSGASGFASTIRWLAMPEAERMPRRDTSVRIVVAFAVDTGRVTRDGDATVVGSSWSIDAFVPVRDSASTCTIVARAHHASSLKPRDSTRLRDYGGVVLGPCAWYGAYGLPGKGMAAWLDSTDHGALENAMRTMHWPRGIRYRNGAFNAWGWQAEDEVVLACIAKREHACEQIVLQPFRRLGWSEISVAHPDGAAWGRQWTESMNEMSAWMLTELEREVGPDGFQTFWKSDLPLPEAFAAARGEPLTEWLARKLTGMYATYRPGPLPAPRTSFALLVAFPGFVALGLYAVRRRATFG